MSGGMEAESFVCQFLTCASLANNSLLRLCPLDFFLRGTVYQGPSLYTNGSTFFSCLVPLCPSLTMGLPINLCLPITPNLFFTPSSFAYKYLCLCLFMVEAQKAETSVDPKSSQKIYVTGCLSMSSSIHIDFYILQNGGGRMLSSLQDKYIPQYIVKIYCVLHRHTNINTFSFTQGIFDTALASIHKMYSHTQQGTK